MPHCPPPRKSCAPVFARIQRKLRSARHVSLLSSRARRHPALRGCGEPSSRAIRETTVEFSARPQEEPLLSAGCRSSGNLDTMPCVRSLEVRPIARLQSDRSEEHTSELQSQSNLVCRLLLEKKKKKKKKDHKK